MDTQAASSRKILLAVTGLSPQVLTETLYALAVLAPDPWIPQEIHLVTTLEGKQRAELALLSEDPGWFHRLLRDYGLPPIAFDGDHIHLLTDASGQPLEDIRTPADNERAADAITELVRQFTADAENVLHVSIAGGRKTMGYYLGYALSLFGRPRDRLSHVLVSEPFESSWDFFYPTPYSRVIQTRDNALADCRDAQVTLADIPFVRLREEVPERLLRGQARFSETVTAIQKAQQPPRLQIDLENRRVIASGEVIGLEPSCLAFYAMMARGRLKGLHPQRHDSEGLAARYLQEYRRLVGENSGEYERAEKALGCDDLKEWFEQRKSKTNRAIRQALGRRLAQGYEITATGKRPKTRYTLPLPPEAIEFVGSGKLAAEDKIANDQNNPDTTIEELP